MKKLAVLVCALCTISATYAAEAAVTPQKPPVQKDTQNMQNKPSKEEIMQRRKAREAAFEQKLGLTDEQKIKAKELRIKAHEKMKPIMEEIKSKKQEAKMVKLSRMAVQAQEEKLAVLNTEIKELEKKANEIRKQNMKEFESILTRNQKKILKQMKQEGRKKFEERNRAQNALKNKPYMNK